MECKGLEGAVWRFWGLGHDDARRLAAACNGASSRVDGGGRGIERLGRHVRLRVVIVWIVSLVEAGAVAGVACVAMSGRGIRRPERGSFLSRVVVVHGMLRRRWLLHVRRHPWLLGRTWPAKYRFVGSKAFVWLARAQRAVHGWMKVASAHTLSHNVIYVSVTLSPYCTSL